VHHFLIHSFIHKLSTVKTFSGRVRRKILSADNVFKAEDIGPYHDTLIKVAKHKTIQIYAIITCQKEMNSSPR
jgi:hypothetical protein